MSEAVDHWLDMEQRRAEWSALLEASKDPESAVTVLAIIADLDSAIEAVRRGLA